MGLRGGLRASTEKQYFSPHIIERPSTFIFHQFPMYIRDLRSLKTNIKDFYFCVIDCKLTLFINLIFIYITMTIFHSWSRRHVIMLYICQCIRFRGQYTRLFASRWQESPRELCCPIQKASIKVWFTEFTISFIFTWDLNFLFWKKKDTILEQHCWQNKHIELIFMNFELKVAPTGLYFIIFTAIPIS